MKKIADVRLQELDETEHAEDGAEGKGEAVDGVGDKDEGVAAALLDVAAAEVGGEGEGETEEHQDGADGDDDEPEPARRRIMNADGIRVDQDDEPDGKVRNRDEREDGVENRYGVVAYGEYFELLLILFTGRHGFRVPQVAFLSRGKAAQGNRASGRKDARPRSFAPRAARDQAASAGAGGTASPVRKTWVASPEVSLREPAGAKSPPTAVPRARAASTRRRAPNAGNDWPP